MGGRQHGLAEGHMLRIVRCRFEAEQRTDEVGDVGNGEGGLTPTTYRERAESICRMTYYGSSRRRKTPSGPPIGSCPACPVGRSTGAPLPPSARGGVLSSRLTRLPFVAVANNRKSMDRQGKLQLARALLRTVTLLGAPPCANPSQDALHRVAADRQYDRPDPLGMNQRPVRSFPHEPRSVIEALCDRLDAAERDERTSRAALLIARHEINRARLRSLDASRRRKLD